MYSIVETELTRIDPNPHRDLTTYPWIEGKVEALTRSIKEVGFWAGVIARPVGDRCQLAFGHHRIEAARRVNLKKVPLIMRDLSDLDMLRFMGRENGEDYHTDFLVLLNTWESAVAYHRKTIVSGRYQLLDIARFLGWTHTHKPGSEVASPAAAACGAAYSLIQKGHLSRDHLRGLTVFAAREITVVANERIRQIEKLGAAGKRPRVEIDQAKKLVAAGARTTADDARHGRVAQQRLRSEVGLNTLRAAHRSSTPKVAPLFAHFAEALVGKISRMLKDDQAGQQLDSIHAVLDQITLPEDHAVIRRLHHELNELALRAEQQRVKITPGKIVKLKSIEE